MKWRFRLAKICLVVLGTCSTRAYAQDGPVEETPSEAGQRTLQSPDKPGDMPHLDPNEPIICVETEEGEERRIQCDDQARRCLVASPYLEIPGARDKVVARMMDPCQRAEQGALERLEQAGYELVPALLETRHGYKRDERGRIYQTHFDMRRRYWVGIYDALTISPGGDVSNRLSADIGGRWEEYDDGDRRRNRHQFLMGRITLDPVELEGLVYGWDRGRTGDEPVFRFVEFLSPEPDRYDISIHLGPGLRFGRFEFEQVDERSQLLIDAAEVHINWELVQSDGQGLEDYILLRGGVGGGFADVEGIEDSQIYGFPELGIEAAWVIDDRGLTQLRGEAAARRLWEDGDNERDRAHANLSFERIILSINEQPIMFFAQGGVEYRSGPLRDGGETAYEALIGGRMSFFTPARPDYAYAE